MPDILILFINNCKFWYLLGGNVTIDEKFEIFCNRYGSRKYNPFKFAKCGLKICLLIDVKIYYTCVTCRRVDKAKSKLCWYSQEKYIPVTPSEQYQNIRNVRIMLAVPYPYFMQQLSIYYRILNFILRKVICSHLSYAVSFYIYNLFI